MTPNDIAALKLAMDKMTRDPLRAVQIESKLKEEPWIDVAAFASYVMQMDNLRLDPADNPPCWIDDPDEALAGPNDDAWHYGAHQAARLLKRMMALGISKYHPDPLAAIRDAEKVKA
jgi:hypothetical protein